jgi:hypothetical protein
MYATCSARAKVQTNPDAGHRAAAALERLLEQQRTALVAGDLESMQATQARMHALLVNPAWQRDAARCRDGERLRAGLRAVAVNADLAARGDAQATRGLSALGAAPAVYGSAGALNPRGTLGASAAYSPAARRAHSVTA